MPHSLVSPCARSRAQKLVDEMQKDKMMITAGRSRAAESMAAMHTPKSCSRQCQGCNLAQQIKRANGEFVRVACPTCKRNVSLFM